MAVHIDTMRTEALGTVRNTTILGNLRSSRASLSARTTPSETSIDIIVYESTYSASYQYRGFDWIASGLRSQLDATSGTQIYLRMFHGGCLSDDGQQNCTAVCADPESVWGDNVSILSNCMTYPVIASALGHGVNVTLWTNYATYPATLIPFPDDFATYGIMPDANLDLNTPAPWSAINQCTAAYCEAGKENGGRCDLTSQMTYKSNWSNVNFSPALYFNTTFCDSVDASINPDLGGVGMVIAYLIQLSIVLGGWALNLISEAGTTAFVYVTKLVGRRQDRAKIWHRRAKDLRRKSHDSQHAAALNATLVEFQKTQAFFMLAVVIAALQAVHNAKYLDLSTWAQVQNNLDFITTVALSGSYPVVLNLMILRRTAKTSPFVLSVSICCVIISSALWLYNQAHTPSQDDFSDSKTTNLAMCGNSNPMQTCSSSSWDGMAPAIIDWVLGFLQTWLFPLIVMAFLTVEEFKILSCPNDGQHGEKINVFDCLRRLLLHYVPPVTGKSPCFHHQHAPGGGPASRGTYGKASAPSRSSRMSRGVQQIKTALAKLKERLLELRHTNLRDALRKTTLAVVNFCYRYMPMLAESGLAGINTMLLVRYLSYQRHFKHAFWTLGQIISVTIWVPVGIEYIYLLAFGIEEGFAYRLKSPYHVRRDADADNGVDSSTEEEESTAVNVALPLVGSRNSSLQNDSDDIEMSASTTNTHRASSEGMSLRSRQSW
ncbi:hypothetical protein LTR17_006679 [Elasticomyces elasticus]|nr:hypothetical protein LTR17_006679 [Elasticomyces elasticus]